MRMVDIINKKKRGTSLSPDEISYVIKSYTNGTIPDYQMSSLLMAIYFAGMDDDETAKLTDSIANSGEKLDLTRVGGMKIDKHSSGGVGDKLSLIIVPLCAGVGIPVAKISGRSLGHTGGTIDKLESIKGFKTELSEEEFLDNLAKYKMAITSQTGNLAPADKKIYALRDVTGTVDSIPLIASSIMSKKIASGCDGIVLDVKVGTGAFMKTLDGALALAKTMVGVGKRLGKTTVALVTDMSQPLGNEVGNANEVKEAIEVLKGSGPEDVMTIAISIASYMAVISGLFEKPDEAYGYLTEFIKSGAALEKFAELIRVQGGDTRIICDTSLLPKATNHIEIKATRTGFVNSIDAEDIGLAAMLLGAGRKTVKDSIDYAAGITVNRKVGDGVEKGDNLCILHTNLERWDQAQKLAFRAYTIGDEKPDAVKYIHKVVV